MKAGATRKPPRATPANLAALGAEALAELLLTASRGDTGLKRVLTLAVARNPQDVAVEIDRQVQRLRTGKGRLTAPKAVALGRELTRLLDGIEHGLGRSDPPQAVIRMLEVLGLAADVLARRTGEGRPVIDAFASVSGRVAGLLDALPEATQATLGEPLQHAFLNAPEEFAAPLMSAAAGALGSAARAALREHLDEELASLEAAARPGASGPRRLRLSSALAQLADAEGDPDAFEAAQNRRAPALRDHVGVAERLLAAGRAQEALSALEAAPRGAAQADISFGETRIRILDALKQREAAQAARWNLFSATLSVDVLRGHLRRLPDFDEVEREEEALRLAERHADTSAVLAFLAAWPDLRRAGAQVRARQGRLDHHDVTLPNLAAALADHDPLAATLLLRARISGLIAARRAGGCAAAGRWIGECAALALTIADWEGRPDHSAYIARLRLTYPRKAALWRAVATS